MSITAAQLVAEVAINGADSGISNLTQIGAAADDVQVQLDATGKAADSFAEMFQMASENMAAALDLPIESVVALQTEAESAFAGMSESAGGAAVGMEDLGIAGDEAGSALIEILLEISQNVKDVGASVDGMSSAVTGGLDDLYSQFGGVGEEAAVAGEEIASAGESATRSGGGFLDLFNKVGMNIFAFQNLATIAGQAFSALFSGDASMEQTTVAFTQLLGSSKAANAELKDLQQFAASTPFEFPELAQATQKLLAFQFPLKETRPLIQAIGDALSALGDNTPAALEQVVNVFGQMNAAGKIQTQDLMQLTSVGINGFQILADQMHKPVPVIKDMISQGLIPAGQGIELLRKGMESTFGPGMAAQAGTWNGLLSTLSDTVGTMWRAFTGPLFKQAEGALKSIGDTLSSQGFTDFAGGVGQSIANVFTTIGNVVGRVGRPIADIGKIVAGNLAPAFGQLGAVFAPFTGIFSHLTDLFPKAKAGFYGVYDALGPLAPIFKPLVDGSKAFADGLASLEKNKAVTGFLSSLRDGFSQVQKIVGGELGKDFQQFGKTAQDVGKWFQTSMLPAIQQAMPGFQHLGSVMATTVAPALAQIWAVGQQIARNVMPPLTKAFETISPIVVRVGGFLADNLGKALQFIAPFAVQAAQEIGKFANEIITRVEPFITNLYNTIKTFLDWIKPYWPQIWDTIQQTFTSTWDIIKGAIQIAWAIVSGVIKIGLDILSGNWKKVWDDIKNMFSGVWDGIKSIASGVWGAVQKPIMAGVDTFKKTWGDTWDGIKKKFSDIWNSLSGVASGAWNNVAGAVRGGINNVIDAIDNFISGVNNIHVSLPGGISLGFNIPLIPHLATGGLITKAGMAIVGEEGPEPVFLPAGAQVIPHNVAFGSGGVSQQPIIVQAILEVDGMRMANGLLPHLVSAIRAGTGVKF